MMDYMSKQSTSQLIGWLIVVCIFGFAVGEGLLYSGEPNAQNLANAFASPSWHLPFGTDQYGRDMFARLGSAVRLSFLLAFMAVFTASILGVTLGVCAAWCGGIVDGTLNFLMNTVLALPGLVLVLLMAAIVPGSYFMLYFAISLVLWVEYFRVVRAASLAVMQSQALQNSQMFGFGRWYVFKRHFWPAVQDNVWALASFSAANAIIMMSSVGFVYVGLKPPTAELGLMIVELFPYYAEAPLSLGLPIGALMLLILSFHLISGKES